MEPPLKPFPSYKWRWATVTPSEGLNDPAVYLGVLRALRQCEGMPPSSEQLQQLLAQVEKEAALTRLSLARSRERNLLRNSGQYWKALGLLGDSHGTISLTQLGQDLADGKVTKQEFAALTTKTLTLPNRLIEDNVLEWEQAELELKPLELVLKILLALLKDSGTGEAYLTVNELAKIVIPLAGAKSKLQQYVEALTSLRKGDLDLRGWPNCTPADNDLRMVREYLIFLEQYGFVVLDDAKYRLNEDALPEIEKLLETEVRVGNTVSVPENIQEAAGLTFVERARKLTKVVSRPGQQKFRREVLAAYSSKCLLTGETLINVLAASHIIPVEYNGPDDVGNGICLRTDVHILFDAGHIRVMPDGTVKMTEKVARSSSYHELPTRIEIPAFLSKECLAWRIKYC